MTRQIPPRFPAQPTRYRVDNAAETLLSYKARDIGLAVLAAACVALIWVSGR